MVAVVKELVFGPDEVAFGEVGVNEVLDAGVGALGEAKLDFEFEVAEGLAGDDVAALLAGDDQLVVLDFPAFYGEAIGGGRAPGADVGSVKEELVAEVAFAGERVLGMRLTWGME